MPAKKTRLSKKDYVEAQINSLLAERYKNECAQEYQSLLDTDVAKKQVESTKVNIDGLNKQIKFFEALYDKLCKSSA